MDNLKEISFLPARITGLRIYANRYKLDIRGYVTYEDTLCTLNLTEDDIQRMLNNPNKKVVASKKISLYYIDHYEENDSETPESFEEIK
jgi:hypothetical protein